MRAGDNYEVHWECESCKDATASRRQTASDSDLLRQLQQAETRVKDAEERLSAAEKARGDAMEAAAVARAKLELMHDVTQSTVDRQAASITSLEATRESFRFLKKGVQVRTRHYA